MLVKKGDQSRIRIEVPDVLLPDEDISADSFQRIISNPEKIGAFNVWSSCNPRLDSAALVGLFQEEDTIQLLGCFMLSLSRPSFLENFAELYQKKPQLFYPLPES